MDSDMFATAYRELLKLILSEPCPQGRSCTSGGRMTALTPLG